MSSPSSHSKSPHPRRTSARRSSKSECCYLRRTRLSGTWARQARLSRCSAIWPDGRQPKRSSRATGSLMRIGSGRLSKRTGRWARRPLALQLESIIGEHLYPRIPQVEWALLDSNQRPPACKATPKQSAIHARSYVNPTRTARSLLLAQAGCHDRSDRKSRGFDSIAYKVRARGGVEQSLISPGARGAEAAGGRRQPGHMGRRCGRRPGSSGAGTTRRPTCSIIGQSESWRRRSGRRMKPPRALRCTSPTARPKPSPSRSRWDDGHPSSEPPADPAGAAAVAEAFSGSGGIEDPSAARWRECQSLEGCGRHGACIADFSVEFGVEVKGVVMEEMGRVRAYAPRACRGRMRSAAGRWRPGETLSSC